MARFRRMLAPIVSRKHYVARTNTVVATGVASTMVLADAVIAPASAQTFEVVEGSVIKAIWIELWVCGNDASGTTSQFILAFEKLPNDLNPMTNAESLNLQAYKNKKNIFYVTQGVLPPFLDGGASVPVLRQWFKIPKGKQRMGLTDRLTVTISSGGGSLRVCGLSTYKEYI